MELPCVFTLVKMFYFYHWQNEPGNSKIMHFWDSVLHALLPMVFSSRNLLTTPVRRIFNLDNLEMKPWYLPFVWSWSSMEEWLFLVKGGKLYDRTLWHEIRSNHSTKPTVPVQYKLVATQSYWSLLVISEVLWHSCLHVLIRLSSMIIFVDRFHSTWRRTIQCGR